MLSSHVSNFLQNVLTIVLSFQTASQAWCLGRYLPLLVGDVVPTDDEKWENFLCLLKIIQFIFAPIIIDDEVDYLQMLIEDYLTCFVELYPYRPLVPKMHYLIHMPTWIKRFASVKMTLIILPLLLK